MKSHEFKFISEIIAFWYCNKHALFFLIPIFIIACLAVPFKPGAISILTGIVAMGIFGHAIASGERNIVWGADEPLWSRPLMLFLVFAGGYLLFFKHDFIQRYFPLSFFN